MQKRLKEMIDEINDLAQKALEIQKRIKEDTLKLKEIKIN